MSEKAYHIDIWFAMDKKTKILLVKTIAKSGFIDPVSVEQNNYNQFIGMILSILRTPCEYEGCKERGIHVFSSCEGEFWLCGKHSKEYLECVKPKGANK